MSYFAKVVDGLVTQVIVADADFFTTFVDSSPGTWVETYNTTPNPRKNYAGIGYEYDATADAFIPPKPFPSWVLNTDTYTWEAPIPKPNDGKLYVWDEENQTWIEVK